MTSRSDAEQDAQDTEDGDPQNMIVRAGYLLGMASRLPTASSDRVMLERAARSLVIAAARAVFLAPGRQK